MTMVMKRNAIGQCDWPDNDIVIVGRELVEEKKAKKVKSGGSNFCTFIDSSINSMKT